MERNVALMVAVEEMGMEEKAAKKLATAQLLKKVENFMSERQNAEARLAEEEAVAAAEDAALKERARQEAARLHAEAACLNTGAVHLEAEAARLEAEAARLNADHLVEVKVPKKRGRPRKNPEAVVEVKVPKKRGRKPNPNKVVRPAVERGEFVLGWETPSGNRRVLKYGPVTRNGEPFQVVHDKELAPEKVAKCHWYKTRNAAEKNLRFFMEQNPEFYAGLQVLNK